MDTPTILDLRPRLWIVFIHVEVAVNADWINFEHGPRHGRKEGWILIFDRASRQVFD